MTCQSFMTNDQTMADFLGLEDVKPGTGLPALANVEILGLFTNLFRTDYELMGSAFESVDELLEVYLYAGEYSHEEHHPIKNFISGILDVTIVKPFIESIYGKDLITGEKLTDFERGMQFVNAIVGAVSLGQGALVLDFTKMAGKDIAVELLKKWGVDAISDISAFTVGYACDELGLPPGVSFVASLLTGYKVSTGVSGYVFRDAGGNVVKELDVDEMQAWLKEMDVDLDDLMVGGKNSVTTSVPDVDVPKSAIGKQKASLEGSLAELADEGLAGIKQLDSKQALDALDYADGKGLKTMKGKGGIKASTVDVDVPKSTVGGSKGTQGKTITGVTSTEVPEVGKVNGSQAVNKVNNSEKTPVKKVSSVDDDEIRYQRFLEHGSTMGLRPEEIQGIQKVDEYLALSKVDYDEVLALRKGVSKGGANVVNNLKPQNLMDELASSGVKYNSDEVIAVTKTAEGRLLWLEQGNTKSGLTHILDRHTDDFASQGIDDIPQLLNDVLKTTPIKTGCNSKGLFADYVFNENTYRVAYGTNGYIVSFYPID